jgi:hypothetical protein
MTVSKNAAYARGELDGVPVAYGSLVLSALHQTVLALIGSADAAKAHIGDLQ